jgi:uncharacterized protein YegJ (DUF2314 family)
MADEPVFMAIRDSDPAFQQTVRDAQASLSEFRRLLALRQPPAGYPCVKSRLVDGEERAFIWLLVVRTKGTSFITTVFEIPPEFANYQVGDEVEVSQEAVADWMVNDDGVLYGGFSLRYQRSLLAKDKQAWFDEHIGVTRYA